MRVYYAYSYFPPFLSACRNKFRMAGLSHHAPSDDSAPPPGEVTAASQPDPPPGAAVPTLAAVACCINPATKACKEKSSINLGGEKSVQYLNLDTLSLQGRTNYLAKRPKYFRDEHVLIKSAYRGGNIQEVQIRNLKDTSRGRLIIQWHDFA